jgi:hypothetical protein
MKLFLATATALALLVIPAHAQREGGAYFGPFSRGDSSGGNFGSGAPSCAWSAESSCKAVGTGRRRGAPVMKPKKNLQINRHGL